MSLEVSNDDHHFYVSAPTSPCEPFNILESQSSRMYYYSLPTSPTRGILKEAATTSCSSHTEPTSPILRDEEDASSSLEDGDGFEFGTNVDEEDDPDFQTSSQSVEDGTGRDQKQGDEEMQHQGRQQKASASIPAVAFADELFCDGKVMPLKPPPRFQYINGGDRSPNPAFPSPRSPTPNTILGMPLPRRSLWNDDYDPFKVALETVREGRREGRGGHRRAWSMFPLRASNDWQEEKAMGSNEQKQNPNRAMRHQNQNVEMQIPPRTPIKLAEPRGVLFARRARLVKVDKAWPRKPKMSCLAIPEEDGGNGVVSCIGTGVSRRHRPKRLFNSSSMPKIIDEHKQMDQNMEFMEPETWNLSFTSQDEEHQETAGDTKENSNSKTTKLSSKSKGLGQGSEKKEGSQVTKMTVVQHKPRPRLLMCMSFGAKYAT